MSYPSLARPPRFEAERLSAGHFRLSSDGPAVAHVQVLEADIIRVAILPDGAFREPRTWTIAPCRADVPHDGRERLDVDGFALPEPRVSNDGGSLVIETDLIRLTIRLEGLNLSWEIFDQVWKSAARDRPTQAYNFGWWGGGVRHYLSRQSDEMVFGLGERTGDQNRAGRRFRMRNLDAFGYDAATTDPLYKHLPFTITRRPLDALSFGLFYDTMADCAFDLGCERDNYHGLYRGFEAEQGDLDYYFIAGPRLDRVVRRFTWLTGRPALMPAWSLGFSGSSMGLAEAPDAAARHAQWLDRCRDLDVPCSHFHLSSGYTLADGKRHVFTWNTRKFHEPAAFVESFSRSNVRLAANVKPALLTDHPRFDEAAALGLFIAEPDGRPALAQFWDGLGAWLDFTNPAAETWWRDRLRESLLEPGVAGVWNDNNEFEIFSPTARAYGAAEPAMASRALQPLLMMRASRQAQAEHTPGRRPFTVSRSGCAGMQRYAQTWSGDNTTAWESLRYNIKMGLGLALSGVSNSGHDIGGFAGPAPDAELLVRWVEAGILMPRCVMHSWNEDGEVTTPWMHEAVVPTIAALLRLRVRLTPYLQYLSWCYAVNFEPMWRPTFYDFPEDPGAWEECDDYMLGPSLLVAPVVAPGATRRAVRAPAGADWIDPWSGARFQGGRLAMLQAPLGRPPILARVGSIVPVNLAPARFGSEASEPGFLLFPPDEGEVALELFADDGDSEVDLAAVRPTIHVRLRADAAEVRVAATGLMGMKETGFLLPPGDKRRLIAEPP